MKLKAVATCVAAWMLMTGGHVVAATSPEPEDHLRWLEEVNGDKALAWVKQQNARTEQLLTKDPQYATVNADISKVINSRERIPVISKIGDSFYNFWMDADHKRGLWRRTTLEEYRKPEPKWEIVLDLDQLAKDENENWVWAGAACLRPAGELCLISLSRGGGDAHVVREFNSKAGKFVKDGFQLPESKGSLAWIDRDHVFAVTDFGPGSLTDSGYPRLVKEWKRGTSLQDASLVFEGKKEDVAVSAYRDFSPGQEHDFIERSPSFFTNELYLRNAAGKLVKVEIPDDAHPYIIRNRLFLSLRSDWTVAGQTYVQGSLITMPFDRFMAGERKFDRLFEPTAERSLADFEPLPDAVVISTLDKVKSRLYEMRLVDQTWQRRDIAVPGFGEIVVSPVNQYDSNDYFATLTDFLTPTTLTLGHTGSDKRETLKSMPAFFDGSQYQVVQHEAVSKDGTHVPYFLISSKTMQADGKNPTLLYGYGGFEVSLTPYYSGIVGNAWLKQGGVYVLANIRGGGEFGPSWHKAALKENRQRAYDDFIAIAEDLIARKITTPRHLGISGGSNGGLLVSAVMMQRPDLFNAMDCAVPLTDMRHFHQMLAGASWMAEYGDPDDPAQWAYLSKFSPYHNVSKDKKYPRVLFTTSTRDDRVHPGHARKMAALMLEQGHDVLYFENTEGGHAGAANLEQRIKMSTLEYTYMLQQLK